MTPLSYAPTHSVWKRLARGYLNSGKKPEYPLRTVAIKGDWAHASSVQKYFELAYDTPLRPNVAARLSRSLGAGVLEGASPPKADGDLSERINSRLDELGMSQATLARLMGVSPAAVQQLCNGSSRTTRHLLEMASALRCDPTWLQTGKASAVIELSGIPMPSAIIVDGVRFIPANTPTRD